MVGIKRLIQEARHVDPPLSPTSIATKTIPRSTDSDTPAVLPAPADSSQPDSVNKTLNDFETGSSDGDNVNSCVCADVDQSAVTLPSANEAGDSNDVGVTEHLATTSLS